MDVSEARRLKALEEENAKLKRLYADAMLDNAGLKELLAKKLVTPAARREAVAHLERSLEMSERRACSIIAADRSVVRCLSRRPDDAALRARLRELADQRRRFGYHRLHVLLRSEGWTVNRRSVRNSV
jgi:putative transposase